MATFTPFDCFAQDVGRGVHDLDTDTLKVALTNTAPDAATDGVLSDITQIANGNGYTTGGATLANNAYSQTSGTGKLTGDDVVWTSVTGNMGPFRYAVLYNDTSATDALIGYLDRGSSLTLDGTNGDTFTLDADPTNGYLHLVP
jgi:hypothetical protein